MPEAGRLRAADPQTAARMGKWPLDIVQSEKGLLQPTTNGMSPEQSKRESDQRGAAFHEAGHIVVAWSFGLNVGGAEIAIGGDDAKGTAEVQTADHMDLLDQLAICAAGLEAQELFDAPTHEGAGWSDYGKMVELLEDLEEEEQIRMMHRGRARASDLVATHRAMVERLAITLLDKKRLEADEVARLLAG